MSVYKKIQLVMADLSKEGISKDRKNAQQGFNFRGIDDVLNALSGLLSKHGLVIIPEVLDRKQEERQTAKGGALFYTVSRIRYTLADADDGSSVQSVIDGEAMDSADKSTNKAMSAAYKYMCIQTFCIPTEGDNDADATTHEVKAKTVTPEQANELLDVAKATDTDVAKILAWGGVKEAIDFPQAKFATAISRMKAKQAATQGEAK